MGVNETELKMIRCPGCRALVSANATKCRMCGEELRSEAAAQEPPRQSEVSVPEQESKRSRIRQRTMTMAEEELHPVRGSGSRSAIDERKLEERSSDLERRSFDQRTVEDLDEFPINADLDAVEDRDFDLPDTKESLADRPKRPAWSISGFDESRPSKLKEIEDEDFSTLPQLSSDVEEQEEAWEEPGDADEIDEGEEEDLSAEISNQAATGERKRRRRRRRKKKPTQNLEQPGFGAAGASVQQFSNEQRAPEQPTYQRPQALPKDRELLQREQAAFYSRSEARINTLTEEPPMDEQTQAVTPLSKPDFSAAGALVGWFVNYEGNAFGISTEIRDGRFFISKERLKPTDMLIANDTISTPHCVVRASAAEGIKVQDMFSDQGTYVRRAGSDVFYKQSGSFTLEHGDWLRLGEYEVQVCLLQLGQKRR